MSFADFAFIVSAIVCVVTALLIVFQKNPVYSVVFMLPFFLGMTTIFVLLSATFLAAIQMIVYGGAILVVFLFVIMLINLKPEELKDDFSIRSYFLTAIAVGVLGTTLVMFARNGSSSGMEAAFARDVAPRVAATTQGPAETVFGSAQNLSFPMFQKHLVPFELASILIVVATLGAVLLSKKKV